MRAKVSFQLIAHGITTAVHYSTMEIGHK